MFFEVLVKYIRNKLTNALYKLWSVEDSVAIRKYRSRCFSTKIIEIKEDNENSALLSTRGTYKPEKTICLYVRSENCGYYENIDEYNAVIVEQATCHENTIELISKFDFNNIPVVAGNSDKKIIRNIILHDRKKIFSLFARTLLFLILIKLFVNLYCYHKVQEQRYLNQYYMEYVSLNKALPVHKRYSVNEFLKNSWLGNKGLFSVVADMQSTYNKHIYEILIASESLTNESDLCINNIPHKSAELNKACRYLRENGFFDKKLSEYQSKKNIKKRLISVFDDNKDVIFDKTEIIKNIIVYGISHESATWLYYRYIDDNIESLLLSSRGYSSQEVYYKKSNYISYTEKIKEVLSGNNLKKETKDELLKYFNFRVCFQSKVWSEVELNEDSIEGLVANFAKLKALRKSVLNNKLHEVKVIEYLQKVLLSKLEEAVKTNILGDGDFLRIKNKSEYYPLNSNSSEEISFKDMIDIFSNIDALTSKFDFGESDIKDIANFKWLNRVLKIKWICGKIKSIVNLSYDNKSYINIELIPSSEIHKLVFEVSGRQYIYLNQHNFKIAVPLFGNNINNNIVVTKCARDKQCESQYYSGAWAGMKLINSFSTNKLGYYCLRHNNDVCAHIPDVKKISVGAFFSNLGALLRES